MVFHLLGVAHFAVLEVLDDVELVLLQHVIVRVQLFILFLEPVRPSFSFHALSRVQFELLSHVVELVFLGSPCLLQVLQLLHLGVNCFLQVSDIEGSLRLKVVPVSG